jgi:ubiquinone/menaquinone biosynthesis C-methylase UbiE
MSRTDYEGWMASAYDAGRSLDEDALAVWGEFATPFLGPDLEGLVLDLGAGTGRFSGHLAQWSGSPVVAVEPATAMARLARSRDAPGVRVAVGRSEAIPLRDASVKAAWLSQVLHHIEDLDQAARELARVVRPAGTVLIRGSLGQDDLHEGPSRGLVLYRYFPEAGRVADAHPGPGRVLDAFARAGLVAQHITQVAQATASSLQELYTRVATRADSTLAAIDDETFAAGLAALRADAAAEAAEARVSPVIDRLDFLVLRPA